MLASTIEYGVLGLLWVAYFGWLLDVVSRQ
jgi:hypothetical protein